MEVAITKMSQNGQIVIPSEIRREAKILPSSKFIVFSSDGNILLKRIDKCSLAKDMALIEAIDRSEQQIARGKVTHANTSASDEEIDDLLMR